MSRILKLARLFRVLEDETISKEDKIANLKMERDNGVISDEEGIELAIEYC